VNNGFDSSEDEAVTRGQPIKGTSNRSRNYPKFPRERPILPETSTKEPKRSSLKAKSDSSLGDVRSIWPKIVEYTGLSEYESKVYLSLLVLLVRPGVESLARHASNISNIHLSLINEQGVVLFRGIRSRTQLHALEMNGDSGYPRLKFTPIQ